MNTNVLQPAFQSCGYRDYVKYHWDWCLDYSLYDNSLIQGYYTSANTHELVVALGSTTYPTGFCRVLQGQPWCVYSEYLSGICVSNQCQATFKLRLLYYVFSSNFQVSRLFHGGFLHICDQI